MTTLKRDSLMSATGGSSSAWRLPRPQSPASFSLILALYSALALPYLVWRSTVINWDVWFAPVLYAAEFYGVLSTGLFLWMTRVINFPRHRPARRQRLQYSQQPRLVHGATVCEPEDLIVAGQLRASQAGPHQRPSWDSGKD